MKNPRPLIVNGALTVISAFILKLIVEILFSIKHGLHWYPRSEYEYNSSAFIISVGAIGAIMFVVGLFYLIKEEAD